MPQYGPDFFFPPLALQGVSSNQLHPEASASVKILFCDLKYNKLFD